MKKKIFILLAALTAAMAGAQTGRALVYSETEKALVYEDTLAAAYHSIIIKTLPSFAEDSVPLKILLPKGKYTMAKSADLVIPMDYRVYIEDTWNEVNYNLNSFESYSFKVKGEEPERFILWIRGPVARLSYAR